MPIRVMSLRLLCLTPAARSRREPPIVRFRDTQVPEPDAAPYSDARVNCASIDTRM